jgi:hypothetical protein
MFSSVDSTASNGWWIRGRVMAVLRKAGLRRSASFLELVVLGVSCMWQTCSFLVVTKNEWGNSTCAGGILVLILFKDIIAEQYCRIIGQRGCWLSGPYVLVLNWTAVLGNQRDCLHLSWTFFFFVSINLKNYNVSLVENATCTYSVALCQEVLGLNQPLYIALYRISKTRLL